MPYTPGATLDGLQASLGSVTLGAVDSQGVAWYLQTLEGWDSPEVRSAWTEREGDHGAWASPVYYGSRPITLGGTIVAPSRVLLEQAMDQLRAAAGLTDTLLVVQESTPKQAVVRRSGKPLMQYVTATTATYSVMVTAADPRRYGTSLLTASTNLPSTTGGLTLPAAAPWLLSATVVAGQVDAVNAGDFETRPTITINGPVVAPQIQAQMPDGSVRLMTYGQDLASGDVLVIDTDARTVTLNGAVSRRRFLTTPSGWPTIPANSVTSFLFRSTAYNSSATLTAAWRSAWQ
ncbi:phage distal tail protein [Streptomyces sp. NPDC058299]|uniref:phage distal tail protein n=1 Tax=unclassified Streptomyces TaxID=2593676 RepID=UPI0036E4F1D0